MTERWKRELDNLREVLPPEDFWSRVDGAHPRRRGVEPMSDRTKRATTVAVVVVVVTLGVALPLSLLAPLGDRDKTTQPAQQPPAAASAPAVPGYPPIPDEWIPLPEEWGDLQGDALAAQLGLVAVPEAEAKDCNSVVGQAKDGVYCLDRLNLDLWQGLALGLFLRGESYRDPDTRETLLTARLHDLEQTDPRLAADINWQYFSRPRLQVIYDEWANAPAITSALPGEDTYVFSDFAFRYPYVPDQLMMGERVEGGTPDPSFAEVAFAGRWSGDVYPGPAQCRITLLDGAGNAVGGYYFEEEDVIEPRYRSDFGTVPVTGEPVSATAVCSAGRKPSGRYLFEDPTVTADVPNEAWEAALVATVHSGGVTGRAGFHICTATASAHDGSPLVYPFYLDVEDGWRLRGVSFPGAWVGATFDVSCEPYTNQPIRNLAGESNESSFSTR